MRRSRTRDGVPEKPDDQYVNIIVLAASLVQFARVSKVLVQAYQRTTSNLAPTPLIHHSNDTA